MSQPDRIGRFVVTGRIGGGGFATVYRATDEALDSQVAIKILAPNWLDQADIRARFVAEARLLRKADSDRVVRVHDIGELPDGSPYFVMTLADRGTLGERLATGPVPWRAAVETAAEITRGLRVLHGSGVLHRDVKPSNVLYRSLATGGEQLLLGDLGLGKLLSEGSVLTMVGGTPAYMAPEQGRVGAGVSVRTDVYGVGAVLFKALTGRGPHEAEVCENVDGTYRAVPPGRLVGGLPTELDTLVRRALAPDPDQRQPSAEALLHELEQVLAAPAPPTGQAAVATHIATRIATPTL
ncbi:MAG TPA: serine/threonine-protein kinase, partial [Pseudonocardiaceae bacterium]